MKRLPALLLLIVSLVLAPLGPVRTTWSCPDGTACVGHGRDYHCVRRQCATRSCCVKVECTECRHGDFPGTPDSPRRRVTPPDHCRFHLTAPTHITVARSASRVRLHAPVVLAILPAATPPVPAPEPSIAWIEDAQGYRPPPLLSHRPARAPPLS